MKTIYDNRIEWRNDKGKRHREDGPAIEWKDGANEWFIDGEYHRLDGPAVEYKNGAKFWYKNGECHRLDGPAISRGNEYKEWWLNGSKYTEEKWFDLLTEDEKLDYILKGER